MMPIDGRGELAADIAARLDAALRHVVAIFGLPGLAIGVVRGGQVAYARGFGVKRLNRPDPVTPTSLFHLASISKTFVATAILQLVARGSVDLDAPVETYLPYFTLADERYREITIEQMLSHQSGMPDEEDYQWDRPEYDDGALERYVRGLAGRRLLFAPGQGYAYSNNAYEVLGDVVAKVSGRAFEDYVAEQILEPLGMRTSTFLKSRVDSALGTTPHLATPRVVVSPVYPYHRAHAPSSTLHSSALEMCNWAIANLNRGAHGGTTILDSSLHDLATSPRRQLDAHDFEQAVGLCWFLGTYRGHRTISHSGGDPGFNTDLVLLPERSLGVVVLANVVPAPIDAITRLVLGTVLGFEPELPKPPVLVAVGDTLAQRGVAAAVEQARRLQGDQADAHDFGEEWPLSVAAWLADVRRFEEAIAVLEWCAALHPRSPEVHAKLATAHRQAGDVERAIAAARTSLDLKPDHAGAAELLAQLLNR